MLDVLLIGVISTMAFAGVMVGFYSYKKFTRSDIEKSLDDHKNGKVTTNAELLDEIRQDETGDVTN